MSFDPAPDLPCPARWLPSLLRGLRGVCPACGTGRMFMGYLRLRPSCETCATALEPHGADDAPMYFTVLLVGHIVVPLMLVTEQLYSPADWIHMALWMPLTLVLSLAVLPRAKGALTGLQWALGVRRNN
ncbi:MAG: DUF983 domain-containing protein [Pirellulaceae bacterium]